MRYAFIRTHERTYRVMRLCAALAVSRSGYYVWRDRAPSAHAVEDHRVLSLLHQIHQEMREAYGAIKLWREARRRGIRCGRQRVVRLRKLGRLEAKRVRRFRIIVEHHQLPPPAPNLLEQRFTTAALNHVWTGDVTMVPTRAGWLYVAVLLDLCSRPGHRLGYAGQAGSAVDAHGARDGDPSAAHPPGFNPSLGSRGAIQLCRVSTAAPRARDHAKHESEGQLL